MISRKNLLIEIINFREKFRSDTDAGLQCRAEVDAVYRFIETHPRHSNDVLTKDTLNFYLPDKIRSIESSIKKHEDKKLIKVFSICRTFKSEDHKSTTKTTFYIENESDLKKAIICLMDKETDDDVLNVKYDVFDLYLKEKDFSEITYLEIK